jgi:hypothetical protein
MDALLVEVFLEAYEAAPTEIILDVDATDDPVHGQQEGRFFQYRITAPAAVHLLGEYRSARLRRADQMQPVPG